MVPSDEARFSAKITFPPFGYVLSVNSPPPAGDLFDISGFAHYGYNEWADVQLRLRAKDIYTWLPGDYRSRDEVMETFRENVARYRRPG